MKKITLVPDIYSQRENPGMYCNYARMRRMKKDVLFAVIIANTQENIQFLQRNKQKEEYPFWVLFLFICPIWAHF